MYLSKEEEKIIDGEKGEVMERLFRLLVRLGDIYGADKMIPIGSVQDNQENTIEVTQFSVSYCINDYSMKYAPYGYIQKNGLWIQTNKPVYSYDKYDILYIC